MRRGDWSERFDDLDEALIEVESATATLLKAKKDTCFKTSGGGEEERVSIEPAGTVLEFAWFSENEPKPFGFARVELHDAVKMREYLDGWISYMKRIKGRRDDD